MNWSTTSLYLLCLAQCSPTPCPLLNNTEKQQMSDKSADLQNQPREFPVTQWENLHDSWSDSVSSAHNLVVRHVQHHHNQIGERRTNPSHNNHDQMDIWSDQISKAPDWIGFQRHREFWQCGKVIVWWQSALGLKAGQMTFLFLVVLCLQHWCQL